MAYKSFFRRPIKSEVTCLDGMGSESMTAFGLFFWIWEAFFCIITYVRGTYRMRIEMGVNYAGLSLFSQTVAAIVVAGGKTADRHRCA